MSRLWNMPAQSLHPLAFMHRFRDGVPPATTDHGPAGLHSQRGSAPTAARGC